jgi:hypothetical protein
LHSSARLHGRWLLLARGGWITPTVLSLAIFFGGLPTYLHQLHTLCAGALCSYQQLAPGQVQTLVALGWSLDQYVALQIALTLLSLGVGLGVGMLIIWRRSDDRMAVLVALAVVAFAPMIATASVMSSSSPWAVPNQGLFLLSFCLYLLVFLLFPSGQFEPWWMRWIFVVLFGVDALLVVGALPTIDGITNNPVSNVGWLVGIGLMTMTALAQVYRYGRVSTPLERQQTKWVVFGYSVPIALNVIGTPLALVPAFAVPHSLVPMVGVELSLLLAIVPRLPLGWRSCAIGCGISTSSSIAPWFTER